MLTRRGFLGLAGGTFARIVFNRDFSRRQPLMLSPRDRVLLMRTARKRKTPLLLGVSCANAHWSYPALVDAMEFFDAITPGVDFKWASVERERGVYDWSRCDALMNIAKARGKRVRMHTTLWGYSNGLPEWAAELPDADLRTAARAFVRAVATRYRGQFYCYDVVNEPLSSAGFLTRFPGLAPDAVKIIRHIDPGARLMVNEQCCWDTPLLDRIIHYAHGIGADGLGLQAHDDRYYYPYEIQRTLDRCRQAGLVVDISEVTRSADDSALTTRRGAYGRWTERAQSNAYGDMLRIALADDNVLSYTVWTLWDGLCWDKRPATGLLREDFSARPSFRTVVDLAARARRA